MRAKNDFLHNDLNPIIPASRAENLFGFFNKLGLSIINISGLFKEVKSGDMVLTMGAGSIWRYCNYFYNDLLITKKKQII